MITGKKIRANLKIQIADQGKTDDIVMLLDFLSKIKTASQWTAFVGVVHKRYGKMSYECHRYYYPTDELRAIYGSVNQ